MEQNKSSFKWRHFEPTIILLCVRWYCRYQLSYRDVEEMMCERGLDVDHSTVSDCVKTQNHKSFMDRKAFLGLEKPVTGQIWRTFFGNFFMRRVFTQSGLSLGTNLRPRNQQARPPTSEDERHVISCR